MAIYPIQKKIILISIGFLFINITSGQTNLYIFETQGSVKIVDKTDTLLAYKGAPIKENQKIILSPDDSVVYINENGIDFELNTQGQYSYKKLVKSQSKKEETGFMKKFFSYVWRQFKDLEGNSRSKSGVVYRGNENNLMQFPLDNVKLYDTEISFSWSAIDNKKKDYFFILKNSNSEDFTIIGTPSNILTLNFDNVLLKKGETYQWAITETKFFNPKTLSFYTFTLLDESSYMVVQKELESISNYLRSLGLSDSTIKKSFCEDYKTCIE